MSVCESQAHSELYGLGIRIAFYIQWFGALTLQFLDESELADVRLLGLCLSGGMTIALVAQVANDKLEASEIYVMILLAAGIWIFLVPLYLWRAISVCSPYWNPFRASKERQSPVYKVFNWIVLVALASVAAWFYTTFLPGLDKNCTQYGFFFSRVSLENRAYIVFNAILWFIILAVCFVLFLMNLGCTVHMWSKEQRRRKVHKVHKQMIRTARNISNLIVFGVLVAGVELSVDWNRLRGVNNVDTAGQVIPLVLSAAFVSRSIFMYFVHQSAEDSSDESSAGGSRRTYRRATVVEEVISGPAWPRSAHTRQ
ncbi:hypothetical protein HJFPF1_10155 [Paramyrothecium foliicola]|nr:hypothetical protein HJFPF1_10155 [Paramyrothecium foliicola]